MAGDVIERSLRHTKRVGKTTHQFAFSYFNSFEQQHEIRARVPHSSVTLCRGPEERSVLESLVMQPKPVAVELDQLHAISSLVEKREEVAAQRVLPQIAADDPGEAIVGLAEVDRLAMDEDANRGRDAQHASTSMTARSVAASKPGRMVTRMSSATSNSMAAEDEDLKST